LIEVCRLSPVDMRRRMAKAILQAGMTAWASGARDKSKAYLEAAMPFAADGDNLIKGIGAKALAMQGILLTEEGDPASARPYLEKALSSSALDESTRSGSEVLLGFALIAEGDLAAAEEHLRKEEDRSRSTLNSDAGNRAMLL